MLNGGGKGGIEPSGIHCCCWFMAPRSVRRKVAHASVQKLIKRTIKFEFPNCDNQKS